MKNRVWFPILAVVLAVALVVPMSFASAHTPWEPYVTDLLAGQTEDVGDVKVWNDADNLYITYEITDLDWIITETHLYVGKNAAPTPAPGQFPYDDEDATSISDTVVTYTIPLDDIDSYSMQLNKKGKPTGVMVADGDPGVESCNDVYIAAHAVVQIEAMREVVSAVTDYGFLGFDDTSSFSNTDSTVNLGTSGLSLLSGFGQLSGYYGASSANLAHRGTRGLGVVNGESDEIDRNSSENPESIVIMFDSPVYVDWFEIRSLFTKDQPPDEHGRVRLFNEVTLVDTQNLIGQQDLGSGPGTVRVDYVEPPEADKLVFDVPEPYTTGHEFAVAALEVFQIREETAWGNGIDFQQPNWAMYFTYHVQSVEPCMTSSGNLTVTGTGWKSVSAWCPCLYTYNLTDAGGPIALQGWVDLSEAAVANTGDWSKYYAKFSMFDSGGHAVEVVFGNDWLGPWYEMTAQQWDRIRMENNMGLSQPFQYYATVGGTLGYDMDGYWVGAGNGATVYPSDGNYFFQLIADPSAENFTLQVYGMGSSATVAEPPPSAKPGWPKQNMYDYPMWLELGTITATGFDFTEVKICATLWASTQAGAEETTTIYWDGMTVDTPVTFGDIPE
jgi:hypothetical protein